MRNRSRSADVLADRILDLWYLPLLLLLRRSPVAATVTRDAVRGAFFDPDLPRTRNEYLVIALRGLRRRTVRTVIYARSRQLPMRFRVPLSLYMLICPGLESCEINCSEIGEGLVLSHGYSSVIWAKRIGRDCTISHCVTLGRKPRDGQSWEDSFPVLGDGVAVAPGAIVLGGIHVGDEAHIGAGAVVIEDVAARTAVAGVPARVVATGVSPEPYSR